MSKSLSKEKSLNNMPIMKEESIEDWLGGDGLLVNWKCPDCNKTGMKEMTLAEYRKKRPFDTDTNNKHILLIRCPECSCLNNKSRGSLI